MIYSCENRNLDKLRSYKLRKAGSKSQIISTFQFIYKMTFKKYSKRIIGRLNSDFFLKFIKKLRYFVHYFVIFDYENYYK